MELSCRMLNLILSSFTLQKKYCLISWPFFFANEYLRRYSCITLFVNKNLWHFITLNLRFFWVRKCLKPFCSSFSPQKLIVFYWLFACCDNTLLSGLFGFFFRLGPVFILCLTALPLPILWLASLLVKGKSAVLVTYQWHSSSESCSKRKYTHFCSIQREPVLCWWCLTGIPFWDRAKT